MCLIKLLDKYTQPNRLDFFLIIFGNFLNGFICAILGIAMLIGLFGIIFDKGGNLTLETGYLLIGGLVYLYLGRIAYSNARMIQTIKRSK